MYNIKILTDSGCDIPVKAKLKHVDILGFYITTEDGKSYEERVDITNKEYYKILENCDKIPNTAHVTMMRYGEKYESLARDGVTDLIVVTINSGASATYNAAVMAKDLFYEDNPDSKMNIQVVDSVSYSVGYGWPIMQADKMIDDGITPDALVTFLKDQFNKTEIIISAYSLKFMKKSGRISAAAAFAGEVMGLKPIISLIKGQTKVLAKVRGDKLVIPGLIRVAKERAVNMNNYVIGYTDEEHGKELYAACVKEFGVAPVLSIELGSAVATNAGNHSIGIMYYAE